MIDNDLDSKHMKAVRSVIDRMIRENNADSPDNPKRHLVDPAIDAFMDAIGQPDCATEKWLRNVLDSGDQGAFLTGIVMAMEHPELVQALYKGLTPSIVKMARLQADWMAEHPFEVIDDSPR